MSEPYPLPARDEQGTVEANASVHQPHRGYTPGEGDPTDNVTIPGTVHYGIVSRSTPGTPGNDGVANRVPVANGNDYA